MSVKSASNPVWVTVVVAGLFGLFFAYAVWSSLAFLLQQAGGVEGLSGYGWFVLLLPVIFPVVAFAGAFALGWRRGALGFSLVMLSALALVAVFWLNILAYASVTTSLYGS